MFDIAIIGAGVVGGMVARELSRYKSSVCIQRTRLGADGDGGA